MSHNTTIEQCTPLWFCLQAKVIIRGVGISEKFDQCLPVITDEHPPADFRET